MVLGIMHKIVMISVNQQSMFDIIHTLYFAVAIVSIIDMNHDYLWEGINIFLFFTRTGTQSHGCCLHWHCGPPLHWHCGLPPHRHCGPLPHWHCGPLPHWHCGQPPHWHCGPPPHWHCGAPPHWHCGPLRCRTGTVGDRRTGTVGQFFC